MKEAPNKSNSFKYSITKNSKRLIGKRLVYLLKREHSVLCNVYLQRWVWCFHHRHRSPWPDWEALIQTEASAPAEQQRYVLNNHWRTLDKTLTLSTETWTTLTPVGILPRGLIVIIILYTVDVIPPLYRPRSTLVLRNEFLFRAKMVTIMTCTAWHMLIPSCVVSRHYMWSSES